MRSFGGGKEGASPNATGGNFILGAVNTPSGTDTTALIAPGTVVLPALFRVDNYSSGSLPAPPAGSTAAGLFHCNNSGGTPISGKFHAIYAQAEAPNGGTPSAIYGLSGTLATPAGDGVTGIGNRGVIGIGGPGGCGCDGTANGGTNGWGVFGQSDIGVGGHFTGGRCALYLTPGTGSVADPNVTVPSGATQGDVYRGSTNGSVWYHAGGTNPYRRLADSTVAGALTLLAAPLRLVDTRNSSGFFDAGNHYMNGTLRGYNIPTLAAGAIPTKARGIIGRGTVVSPTQGGGLNVSPVNPPGFGSAIVNFAANQVIGAPFTSALNASGQIFVQTNLFAAGTVDVVLDVLGYYY